MKREKEGKTPSGASYTASKSKGRSSVKIDKGDTKLSRTQNDGEPAFKTKVRSGRLASGNSYHAVKSSGQGEENFKATIHNFHKPPKGRTRSVKSYNAPALNIITSAGNRNQKK